MGLRFVGAGAEVTAVTFAVLPALISAQRFFAPATMALRPAALSLRLRGRAGMGDTGAGGCPAFAGRPRRFTGAPSASIARLSLSRSEIKSDTICSVDISDKRITSRVLPHNLTWRTLAKSVRRQS